MSHSDTVDEVVESGDSDSIAKQSWMKAELSLEAPVRGRSGAFLGKARTPPPKPQWVSGTTKPEGVGTGPTLGKARDPAVLLKTFEDAYRPLKNKLDASLLLTTGLKGVAGGVAIAEKTSTDAAAAAEKAASDKNFSQAMDLVKSFETTVTDLDKAYTDACVLLDTDVGKKLGKLVRRRKGLKGTDLALEAAQAKSAQEAAELARDNANKAATPAARLAGLVDARDKAVAADTTADNALKQKSNTNAAKGIAAVKTGFSTAVSGLAAGDVKTALALRVTAWEEQKNLCDAETDPAKKKALLTALDEAARKLMVDARDAETEQKKQAALKVAKDAGPDKELDELIKATKQAIAALADGDAKTKLEQQCASADQFKLQWDPRPDSVKKQEAMTKLDTFWRRELQLALEAQAEAKRQAVFKKALEDRFGLTIEVPAGMSNTNFDQFYEMMNLLPVQQSMQSSLKVLAYDKTSSGAAFWPGGTAKVEMGNFGAKETWDYQDPANPATKLPMTAFSINTLHEIGHAVDEKYKVMTKNGQNPGCAAWNDKETLASVIKAFVDDLKATGGNQITTSVPVLNSLFNTALTKGAVEDPITKQKSVKETGDTDKPATMTPQEWNLVKAQLNKAVKIREDNWPWGAGSTVTLGGRAYHESYTGQWVSYDPAARAGTEVRDYQFRSPAEWFAELYAYTWFKKTKPPGAVDKVAAKYMYSAKA